MISFDVENVFMDAFEIRNDLDYQRRRRRRRRFCWLWLTEDLEVTVKTEIAGTSITELGTRVELAEALEVTVEAERAGTSDTKFGTRAELVGKGCEGLMEVIDKLTGFSEAAWPTGCWALEVIPN